MGRKLYAIVVDGQGLERRKPWSGVAILPLHFMSELYGVPSQHNQGTMTHGKVNSLDRVRDVAIN